MKLRFLKIYVYIFVLIIGGCAVISEKQDRLQIHVKDYGVSPKADNNHDALVVLFDSIKKMNKPVEVLFEKNAVYRVGLKDGEIADDSKIALIIDGIDNLIINGQGATYLVTNPEIGALSTQNCNHLEVKNLYVDYDILPFTQGVITAVNTDEYWFELKLDKGYPKPDEPQFEKAKTRNGNWGIAIRDLKNGRRSYGPTILLADKWEKTNEGVWRFHVNKTGAEYNDPLVTSGLKIGDPYVHMSRNWATCFSAISCDDVLWENIIVFSSAASSFFPHMTSNHTIRNCHVKIKEGRIFTSDGDGIHMRGSRGNVLIEDCSFEGMADDGINLHSSPLSIQKQLASNKVLVRKATYSVKQGDELVLVKSSEAKVLNKVIVESVEDKGANWLVTLESDLPKLEKGEGFASSDNLYNLSEQASPFIIRNCVFKDYRGRGTLISAQNGVIENNKYYVNEGWGVVFSYETARWAEGPLAENIVIRNNEFYASEQYHMPAIFGHIIPHVGTIVTSRPYQNISIENNKFYEYTSPVIELHNTQGISIKNNEVKTSNEAVRLRNEYSSVVLKNCKDVNIENLSVSDTGKELKAIVEIDKDCASGENIVVGNLKLKVSEECKTFLDRRK